MLVGHIQMVGAPTIAANRMRRRVRQRMVIKRRLASGGQESGESIGQPQRTKDIHRSFAAMRIRLGIEQWSARWQSIIAPYPHDVRKQLRLLIQILPRGLTAVVGIMLNRNN